MSAVAPPKLRSAVPNARHSREGGNPASFARYPKYKDSDVAWLGEVPSLWHIDRLKHHARLVTDKATARMFPVALENIEGWSGQFVRTEGEFQGDGVAFEAADILFGKLRPYLAKVYLTDRVGEAVGDFHVLRFDREVVPRYAQYQMLQREFIDMVGGSTFGSKMPRASWEFLGAMPFVLPSHDEQSAIATFLDRETAKIDALIAEQEKLIALLKEKRQALISHAVTKGLDPNAPMKDSGIEWLGQVPAHWRVLSLGRITESKCDGPFGSGLKSEHYVDEGARVIRLQNIRGGAFDDHDVAFIDMSYFKSDMQGHDVREDDVLVAGLGDDNNPVGRACVAPSGIYPAIVKADCFRFRLDRTQAYPPFVAWALTVGSRFDSGALSSGSTRSRIPLSVTATRQIPLPPVDEQCAIVASIEQREIGVFTLVDLSERAIMLLKEHRSALISAAVTGKIDVRDKAASNKQDESRAIAGLMSHGA